MPDFFKRHNFFRRLVLIWACVLITIAVLRVTEPEVITVVGAAGATIITGVIGILATVITFYLSKPGDK